jgi:serine O-acetyltransferase
MAHNDIYTSLVYAREYPGVGRLAYLVLKLMGMEIPRAVRIGSGLEIAHGGFGIVIHPNTVIGERVKLYPGVTLGRADIHLPVEQSQFEGIILEDDVVLSSGSKVLCKEGILHVRRGTVLGANAVLLCSTGENEIWAGVPARCIGFRGQSSPGNNQIRSSGD